MAKLSLKNVSMIYVTEAAATPAVKDISIDVAEGEFVSLIGPSGCGKTTILSLIAACFPRLAERFCLMMKHCSLRMAKQAICFSRIIYFRG